MVKTVSVQNVMFTPGRHSLHEPLASFTYLFTFGKSFLLDGWPWDGGATLSWIVGGVIQQDHGTLLKNGVPYEVKERKKDAWCVRTSRVRVGKFSFVEP